MSHERCKCVRKIQIKDTNELDNYIPGNVFRMKNIASAYKVEDHTKIVYQESDMQLDEGQEQGGGVTVYFFIYSQMGKFINDFFPPKLASEIKFEDTIVFMAGTEFLVCKHEKVYDEKMGKTTHHIYLREIQIGFGENNILICDDKIYDNWAYGNIDYIRR